LFCIHLLEHLSLFYNQHMQENQLRPLDTSRDLLQVADLIEMCFADQMDADGREYVRQIRRSAQNGSFGRWLPGADDGVTMPIRGFVWEENGRIVGNLTLIPFHWKNSLLYMIANVAVNPAFRHQGIGRLLTQKALQHVKEHGAASAWLQVRNDNPIAEHLYRQLGFVERARRTTWETESFTPPFDPLPETISITSRRIDDWPLQSKWLDQTYPSEVAWNLPFYKQRFSPSIWQSILRFFQDQKVMHWVVRQKNRPLGTVTWEPTRFHSDIAWVGTDPANEDLAIGSLLINLRMSLRNNRPIALNYPYGRGIAGFHQACFSALNTLLWMEIKYK
jgi:ribosomal protein S18 acetylase RimI-like enzyme